MSETGKQLWQGVIAGAIAMTAVVVASNILVQFPINDWLTWGAFTYPIAFLVTDLSNRSLGPARARRVVYVGFAVAVLLSIVLATPRIALASGSAFLIAQLLDIAVFDRLRRGVWWQAPVVSSGIGSVTDTAIFFSLAFAGTGLPWVTWGLGDLGAKVAMALLLLVIPSRILKRYRDAVAALEALEKEEVTPPQSPPRKAVSRRQRPSPAPPGSPRDPGETPPTKSPARKRVTWSEEPPKRGRG